MVTGVWYPGGGDRVQCVWLLFDCPAEIVAATFGGLANQTNKQTNKNQ
jgi:hypothetical protein